MRVVIYIILSLSIIFFLPIPVIVKFCYKDSKNYYVKLYNFIIISSNHKHKKSVDNSKSKAKKTYDWKFKNYKTFLINFYNLSFKPLLYLTININYSFSDNPLTAVVYGALYSCYPLISSIFSIPFKVKKLYLNVNPLFKSKVYLNLEISSIFFISFANITYITFFILKHMYKLKEVTPN